MDEQWRNIPGVVTSIEVSSIGRVRRVDPDGSVFYYALTRTVPAGYLVAMVKGKRWYVHRLVALAFLQNPQQLRTVNHINFDKTDNRVGNLEWMTYKENLQHARATLGNYNPVGSKNGAAKLTEQQVRKIRKLLESGLSQKAIAKRFGVTGTTIGAIRSGKNWSHVK